MSTPSASSWEQVGTLGLARIRGAQDYDDTTAPSDGQAILWVASGGRYGPRTITPAAIGAAPAGHTHPAPLVPNPPVTLAYAATVAPNASSGNYFVCTLTGNLTLNPPTNATEGQRVWFRAIASGAARTVSFGAGFKKSTGVGTSIAPATGKRADIGMIYEAADGWTITVATAQQ